MKKISDYTKNNLEFKNCISDLLKTTEVQSLDNYTQHLNTSRLDHSLSVSYYSFKMSKFFKLDYKSSARAGLLHDLYLYDWRVEKQPEGNHAFAHPIVALRTAKEITSINDIESDAILNHMWPLATSMPRYKESIVVSIADKFSTCVEVKSQLLKKAKSFLQIHPNTN